MDRLRKYLNRIFTKEDIRTLIFLEVVVGIVLSLGSLALFLFITNAVVDRQTVFIDNTIEYFVYSFRPIWLDTAMWFTSLFGNELLITGSVIFIILLTRRKHKKETVIFLLLLLMGLTVTEMLKILLKIPRPNISALIDENSYSYPSGHALNAFLFYAAVSYFIYHFTRKKLASAIVTTFAIVIILLVGISRIYLGVHHPSDVLAGYVAGFWLFATTILVDKTMTYFRLFYLH